MKKVFLLGVLLLNTLFADQVKIYSDYGEGKLKFPSYNDSIGYIVDLDFDSSNNAYYLGYYTDTNNEKALYIEKQDTTGALVSSFGTNGQKGGIEFENGFAYLADYGEYNSPQIALQSDGKVIIAVSYLSSDGGSNTLLVQRYTTTGVLDTTFGTDGNVTFTAADLGQAGTTYDYLYTGDMVIDGSNNIIIGGAVANDDTNRPTYAYVLKLTSSGALDTSFSGDGIYFPKGNDPTANSGFVKSYVSDLEIDSSGKIVAGMSGDYTTSATLYCNIHWINTSGTSTSTAQFPDYSTGSGQSCHSGAITIDGSDNVYMASLYQFSGTSSLQYLATVKYNSSGSRQWMSTSNFVNGSTTTIGMVRGLVIDSDSEVIVGGHSYNKDTGSSSANPMFLEMSTSNGALNNSGSGVNINNAQKVSVFTENPAGGFISAGSAIYRIGDIEYSTTFTADSSTVDSFGTGVMSTHIIDNDKIKNLTYGSIASTHDSSDNLYQIVKTNADKLGVLKLDKDGKKVSSFGTDGYKDLGAFSKFDIRAATVGSSGKIYVVGQDATYGRDSDPVMYVLRLNSDGSIDTSYGSSGYASIKYSDGVSYTHNPLAIKSFNSGEVAVSYYNASGSSPYYRKGYVALLNSSGGIISKVNTYGNAANGSESISGNMIITDDDDYVLIAHGGAGGNTPTISKIAKSNGAKTDYTGSNITNFKSEINIAKQSDGKYILAAEKGGASNYVTFVRFNSDFSLDTSFGSSGSYSTFSKSVQTKNQFLYIDPDNDKAVAFIAGSYGSRYFLVADKDGGSYSTASLSLPNIANNSNYKELLVRSDGNVTITGAETYAQTYGVVTSFKTKIDYNPDINISNPLSVEEGTASIQLTAEDENTDSLTWGFYSGDSYKDNELFTISSSGILTFVATPDYENPETTDSGGADNSYTVSIVVTDEVRNQDSESSFVINITNAPPYVTAGQSFTIAEDIANSTTVGTVATTGDTPSGFSITAGDDNSAFAISSSGEITVNDTSKIDYESATSFTLTVEATDGAVTDSESVTINITNVAEAPVISSNGGGATAPISISENLTAVTTVIASDGDGDTITYAISGGADSDKFTINSSTGVLAFSSAPDYENATDSGTNNTYEVIVSASDSSLSGTQTITVTITDAGFMFTNSNSVSINENSTDTIVTINSAETAGLVAYGLKGTGDDASFSIDAWTGELRLNSGANYEVKNTYNITVTANNNGEGSYEQAITVNINDVDEAPEFTNSGSTDGTENSAYTYTPTVSDPEGGVAEVSSVAIPSWMSKGLTSHSISTYLGTGTYGTSADGTARASANSVYINDVALNSSGVLYFTEPQKHLVRYIDGSGNVQTVAGSGSYGYSGDNGAATSAKLYNPESIAFDSSNNLYIADRNNHCIRKVSSGTITTVAGRCQYGGSSGDGGVATSAKLYYPGYVHIDNDDNLWISDSYNHKVRMVPSTTGTHYGISMTAGNIYTVAGTGTAGDLDRAVDTSGSSYSADSNYWNSQASYAFDGKMTTRWKDANGGSNYNIGLGINFNSTKEVDTISFRKRNGTYYWYYPDAVTIKAQKSDNSWVTLKSWHTFNWNSCGTTSECFLDVSIESGSYKAFDFDFYHGHYSKDPEMDEIVFFGGTGPMAANTKKLYYPEDIHTDSDGNLYIADSSNHKIKKVDTNGYVTIFAGDDSGYAGDGGDRAGARFKYPIGLDIDENGNLYIGDRHNNALRKIDREGVVSTITGTGVAGFSGDSGTPEDAQLRYPTGVAVDDSGNIYIADRENLRIRKVSVPTIQYSGTPTESGVYDVNLSTTDGTNTAYLNYQITVTDVNDAPILEDYAFAVSENNSTGSFVGEVNATDEDYSYSANNEAVTFAITAGDTNNDFAIDSSSGEISIAKTLNAYTKQNYSLTITATDADSATDTGVVTISVTDEADAPVATNDTVTVNEDSSNNSISILSNDSDKDNNINSSSVTITTTPQYGTVSVNSNGSLSYTPNADFYGEDAIFYKVYDKAGLESNEAYVEITVSNVNDTPVTYGGTFHTDEDIALSQSVSDLITDADGEWDLDISSLAVAGASNGSVSISDGIFTYTPDLNYYGVETFTLTIDDTNGTTSNSSTIYVNVAEVNDVPIAYPDSATTNEDTAKTIDLTANDTDDNGIDDTKVIITKSPSHGSVVDNDDGTVTYTPDSNWYGVDTFKYAVYDTGGADNGGAVLISNESDVVVTVSSVNDTPTANNDEYTIDEDSVGLFAVDNNDTDVEDSNFTIAITSDPSNGTATVTSNNLVRYIPNKDYFGADSFQYSITDGDNASDTATVNLTVNSINDKPSFSNLSSVYSIQENSPVMVATLNALDVEDNTPIVISISGGDDSSLFEIDGNILKFKTSKDYEAPEDSNSDNSYDVEVQAVDSLGASKTVAIKITITNDSSSNDDEDGNGIPDDEEGGADSDGDGTPDHKDSDNDNDGIPDTEEGTGDTDGDGTPDYKDTDSDGDGTPDVTEKDKDSDGDGTPDYKDSDDNSLVLPNRSFAIEEDVSIGSSVGFITVTSNTGSATQTYSISSGDSNSDFAINSATGAITTAKTLNAVTTSFYNLVVTVVDSARGTTSANVAISVADLVDAPIARENSVTLDEESSVTVDILFNDYDKDGNLERNSLTIVRQPSNGSVSVDSDNNITYTPQTDFFGTDYITYKVFDTIGLESNEANVTFTVANINDNPIATNSVIFVGEDTNITLDLSNFVSDPDGSGDIDATTFSITNSVDSGIIIINNNSIEYEPNSNFYGSDSFIFKVQDGNGSFSNEANITLVVANINDVPIANNDVFSVVEDNTISIDIDSNDTDLDGNSHLENIVILTEPSIGTLSNIITTNGTMDYIPDGNATGVDSFTYSIVDDNNTMSTPATVTINISAVNDAPIAFDDSLNVTQNVFGVINILNNDVDAESTLDGNISFVSLPSNGDINTTNSGVVRYIPNQDYVGADSFTYKVGDGELWSNTATVTFTILADEDRDGISDNDEGKNNTPPTDTDGDGTPDYQDEDSDGDGLPDSFEGNEDSDGDGTPDNRDSDSDGDGIPDSKEGVGDTDKDGIPDIKDTDSDGDGTPDGSDTDNDNDGIPDSSEGSGDSDSDGIPDSRDDDSDGDGKLDIDEGNGDSDGDGIPNYKDSNDNTPRPTPPTSNETDTSDENTTVPSEDDNVTIPDIDDNNTTNPDAGEDNNTTDSDNGDSSNSGEDNTDDGTDGDSGTDTDDGSDDTGTDTGNGTGDTGSGTGSETDGSTGTDTGNSDIPDNITDINTGGTITGVVEEQESDGKKTSGVKITIEGIEIESLFITPSTGTSTVTSTEEGVSFKATVATIDGEEVEVKKDVNINGTSTVELSKLGTDGSERSGRIISLIPDTDLQVEESGETKAVAKVGEVEADGYVTPAGVSTHIIKTVNTSGESLATVARSNIKDSTIYMLENGSLITTSQTKKESSSLNVVVTADNSGKAVHLLEITDEITGEKVSVKADFSIAGAQTEIQEDGTIETTIKPVEKTNISVKALTDGSALHQVEIEKDDGTFAVSKASSKIVGAQTLVDTEGKVNTQIQKNVSRNGSNYTLKVEVITSSSGESQSRATWVNSETGENEITDNTTSEATLFEENNEIEIVEENSKVFIDVVTPVTKELVIE